MSSLLGCSSQWHSAIRLPSWGSSAWDPGFGRGTGRGFHLSGPLCPFLGRLALFGAEEGMVEHLAGRVLCAGGQAGMRNSESSGDLPPSDLWGVSSSLWEDARDEALGSREAPFLCRALGVLLSDNRQGLLDLPWVKMHTVSPAPQSGGCVHSHLDLFQTPSEGHNQMA